MPATHLQYPRSAIDALSTLVYNIVGLRPIVYKPVVWHMHWRLYFCLMLV